MLSQQNKSFCFRTRRCTCRNIFVLFSLKCSSSFATAYQYFQCPVLQTSFPGDCQPSERLGGGDRMNFALFHCKQWREGKMEIGTKLLLLFLFPRTPLILAFHRKCDNIFSNPRQSTHHLHDFPPSAVCNALLAYLIFGVVLCFVSLPGKCYSVLKCMCGLQTQSSSVLALMLIIYAALDFSVYWKKGAYKVFLDTFLSPVTMLLFI